MTISRTTRQSFVIALDFLTNLVNTLTAKLERMSFESMTTPSVESFFNKRMRADNDMPTVLQYV